MEKKKVQIILRSTQPDSPEGTIEQTYTGEYSFRNDTHFITYKENYDREGHTADIGTSLIKIKDNSVYLLKKGIITTRMEFDTLKSHFTPYRTPYGTFQLEIVTEELAVQRDGDDFLIHICYYLNIDGKPLSQYCIELRVLF